MSWFGQRQEPGADELEALPPFQCTEQEVQRWNDEWLQYLRSEWEFQLAPYTAYPDKPPLPDSPLDLMKLSFGFGWPIALYCDREALEGRRVMEMGCGCGNLGKLIARYTESYLGTDYSTLALQIARLVSPPSCTYVHVADRAGLTPFFGRIDTVISRFFWIHQNFALARQNLEFLALFLKPGGRLYADFFWPDPKVEQAIVFTPDRPLSKAHPSATFRYSREDVERLVAGHPFRILRETVSTEMQRRYVVLERRPAP
ncbi:MAG: class I SAM-dependent methyltransferase [Acidobacteria bacterium]|nr:class I SAM-dependent methyltransferase [Acidobacteriota bacterium]